MPNRTEYLSLDVSKENTVEELIVIQQGENASLTIHADVYANGDPLDLDGTTALFLCVRPDGTCVQDEARVVQADGAWAIEYDVADAVAAAFGKIGLAYFELSKDVDGSLWVATTDSFGITVKKGVGSEQITSGDEWLSISAIVAQMQQATQDAVDITKGVMDVVNEATEKAEAAVETATNAADVANAATEAVNTVIANAEAATEAANAAVDTANEAAASVDASKAAADDAAQAANTAASQADTARDAAQAVADNVESYMTRAEAAATGAEASQAAAKASETAAAASASTASAKADAAASSESAAAASANSASASKDAAAASEANAAASEASAKAAADKAESIAGFTVDDTITADSTNPAASKAVYNYVTQMFADFTAVTFEIVDSYAALPATGAAGTFYFVPAASTGTSDMYSEYVWLNGAYEKFGDIQLPDLSPYAKMTWVTEQLSAQLASYYTKSESDGLLAAKQDVLTIDAVPTSGSANPVQSGGVHSALASKADASTVTALSDTVNTLSGTVANKADASTVTALSETVAGKQDALTFDSTPTSGSSNPVTSGGVYTELAKKADYSYGTEDLTASVSELADGTLYFVYE